LAFQLNLTRSAALLLFGRAMLLAPRPVVRMADAEISYGRVVPQAGAGLRVAF
jgi:hypothetical protein